MTWAEVDPTIKEWCFAREVMRRLGFGPDDLFFIVNPSGKVVENGEVFELGAPVLMLRVAQAGREFMMTVGPTALAVDAIEAHFQKACEIWNSTTIDMAEFRRSRAFLTCPAIIQAMMAKGFRRPGSN